MQKPKRCFELKIEIGGDEWAHVGHQLQWLANHLDDHGPACNSAMGSIDSYHLVAVEHRPEITPEIFQENLKKYVEQLP